MELTKEKLEELMNDESFAEGWGKAETKEDILQLLAKQGIEVPADNLDSVLEEIPDIKSDEELSDDNLEEVAGGSILDALNLNRGSIIRNGGCGSRCPLCGRTNGFFGHVCPKAYLYKTSNKGGLWNTILRAIRL